MKKEYSKIKKNYLEKIKIFKKYNEAYYDKNDPVVKDSEYDSLKSLIIELEKNHSFLNSKDSPSINVGYKPSKNFKKARHKIPMLSLNNAFDKEDLVNFEKKNYKFPKLEKKYKYWI